MSPVGTSSPAWSPWTVVSPQNASLERATFVQLAYAMTRNETASPIGWSNLRLGQIRHGRRSEHQPRRSTLTMTSDLSLLTDAATLDLVNAELTFSVPQDATPQGESRMWLGWTPTDAALMVEHGALGVLLDVDTDPFLGQTLCSRRPS